MKGKLLLGINALLSIVTLVAALLLVRSHFAVTSRYTELERAGCINEAALNAYSVDRFRPDYRQDVAGWIAQPAFDVAAFAVSVLAITVIANLAFGIIVVLREKG